jgi:hypothetical protein
VPDVKKKFDPESAIAIKHDGGGRSEEEEEEEETIRRGVP